MSTVIKVKYANFYHIITNRFNTNISTLTGYGNIYNTINQTFIDTISNPTGFEPLVYYKTGILTAEIQDGSGSYTWNNLQLFGAGEPNRVYANYITGYKQASNSIEFINSMGSGLQSGDLINIANTTFTYIDPPRNLLEFNSPQRLINILNSGALGLLNDQNLSFLQTSVGITGYLENNILKLFSLSRSGENGNNIRIYRDCQNINAVKINSRYFTGGISFRPIINNWIGNFSNTFDNLTVENSGFYNIKIGPVLGFANVSGVSWVDNFSGNYFISTGFKDPRNPGGYTGYLIKFNTGINQYSGFTIIPKNSSVIYTGLNIEISKPNPYNILGNISLYTISGNNFIFTGLIEG